MSGSGYQQGGEPAWWWKVAMHLDQAQLALANAMAHNVDDPRLAHALYHRLREGQAILLDIFRAKGLLPTPSTPPSEMPAPPAPQAPPMAVVLPFPAAVADEAAAVPTTEIVPPVAAEDPVVLEADQASATAEAEIVDPAAAIPVVDPAAIASGIPAEVPVTSEDGADRP